ncbi:Auxin Efflux Carrier [Thioalkalivibrio nitratireducens DSM 14787]|uniref:Auxin Efflux Carrier n=1 Tax=Thioalkalivibrio nitratireducens (strain DSM 14787 / UNIQEM 213 / ALEN2) TaxID=1255043 RepID=L0DZ95_THIND|nr:AEC family transporter [Thioalkalivibrio nitratireducens]AGA34290.1 Auxin Efflux Carrier [Thioalkalivibrio nitratireducens DSM 14787]
MLGVMTQMGALIACGVAWGRLRPGGLRADETRRVLTTLVYYLLLPALVLKVLWTAPLGLVSLKIAAVAGLTVIAALALTALACRLCAPGRATLGAMMLAAAWPNAVYLGLPILDRLFGDAGRAVAIQYDLFGALPLLLTVGVLIARHFGTHDEPVTGPLRGLFAVPSIWAAFVAVVFNVGGVPMPGWLDGWLGFLGHAVTPLMLFSLGLALMFDRFRARAGRALAVVAVVQLLAAPLVALGLALALGLQGVPGIGTVLEAAMPAMVLGIVFCDRFGLDTGLYAAAVTLTTALSLVTLPLWYALLQLLPALQ